MIEETSWYTVDMQDSRGWETCFTTPDKEQGLRERDRLRKVCPHCDVVLYKHTVIREEIKE